MKILIPLLSKTENKQEFLAKALEGAKEVILLLVVDTKAMPGQFGFAATEIRQGNTLMEEIKKKTTEKKKKCTDVMEWGDTLSKILNATRLYKANKIVLKKQDNKFFEDLVKELEHESVQVEII